MTRTDKVLINRQIVSADGCVASRGLVGRELATVRGEMTTTPHAKGKGPMTWFKKTSLLTALATLMMAGSANALTIGFAKITNNGNPDVASQLAVDVTAGSGGSVDFKFTNNVGIASSITDIYFDDGTLLALASITDSGATVAFTSPATPGNLPGGNLATPPFVTTANFSADSDSPILANGVDSATEFVTINFTLQGGQTYADTLAALASGALRIGLHVQGIGDPGGSDSYVNTSSVPDGGMTISLLGLALGGMGLMARRKTAK
jgi:hypothetical protein